MSNVKNIVNTSSVTVPVKTADGTIHLPPKASLGNVSVSNLSEVKKNCRVTEDLSEIARGSKGKRING